MEFKLVNDALVPLSDDEMADLVARRAAAAAALTDLSRFPLSRRQVRKAMVFANIGLDAVDNAIAAMPAGEARDLAMIDWQDATVYERSHPLFDQIATTIGITSAQLDSLWLWAASFDA